ncbi:hypothetical protein C8255_06330 [filamentous cyanobacterium CCP3]|nr:hypothetical protein C8255_06330 [filamentous cyanobacterium CCP3]
MAADSGLESAANVFTLGLVLYPIWLPLVGLGKHHKASGLAAPTMSGSSAKLGCLAELGHQNEGYGLDTVLALYDLTQASFLKSEPCRLGMGYVSSR